MAVVLPLLVASAGCDRRTGAWVPIEAEPPAPARPVRIPGLEEARPQQEASMPEPGARRGMSGAPTASGPTAPTSPESAADDLAGVIRLADGVSAPGGVLFLIARSTGGGPPLAVLKVDSPSFPLEFRLGQANVMMQGRRFEGEMTLEARVDLDGNAMTRDPREPAGAVPGLVAAGTKGIEIVLSPGSR